MWKYKGDTRPPFAREPKEGEESVWDYPRPPKLAPDSRLVTVKTGDIIIAKTNRAIRVLETASPPAFYISPEDVAEEFLQQAPGSSFCEWKGKATYWNVITDGKKIEKAAWSYNHPNKPFKLVTGYYSFYPSLVDCFVEDEKVKPQPGGFYGGWVTSEISGPMKGEV